jgi:vacuolar-type H+-ATPase subunit I/STV1
MSNLTKNPVEEDDLDDLDDYLDEFQDEILSKPAEELAKEANQSKTEGNKDSKPPLPSSDTNEEELSSQLESVLKELEGDSPEAKAQFESLLKNVTEFETQAKDNDNKEEKIPTNLKDTISSTLNRLKESGSKVDQSIKDEEPDQLLENLLKQLNLGDGQGDLGSDDFNIGDLLGDLLDQLASKAIIYEPLKDLRAKYPKWINENKEKTPDEDLKRYTLQSEIVESIVAKFEEESYSDQSKPHRAFISQKLEEMQNSGNPPPDLTDDLSKTGLPGFQFDGDDLPEDLGKDIEKDLEENCQQQ